MIYNSKYEREVKIIYLRNKTLKCKEFFSENYSYDILLKNMQNFIKNNEEFKETYIICIDKNSGVHKNFLF